MDLTGGSNAIVPGGFQQSEVVLKAGHYVMLCFVAGADGLPHIARGMVMPFDVTGDATGATAPSTVGTVQLKEYSVTLPAGFGKGRYEISNSGKEPHELTIVRLADGKTMNDVMAAFQPGFQGAPPFTSAGGVNAVSPGGTAYGDFDLAPGNYIALCFVPGPSGVPHAAMGMMQPFTVS